jgi:YD repeat-containing protein
MQYRYDSMGNIIEVSENGRMVCRYEYDALNRLTREDNVAFGKTSTWTYDNNGNIVGIPGFASIHKKQKLHT